MTIHLTGKMQRTVRLTGRLSKRVSLTGRIGLVAVAWWLAGGIDPANCIAAYQAKGAASQAASYVNLANPGTYDLTTPAAPTWSAETGWTFDGTTQYLDPRLMSGNGWSVLVRYSGAISSGSSRMLFGHRYSQYSNNFRIGIGTDVRFYYNSGWYDGNASPFAAAGVVGMAPPTYYVDGEDRAGSINGVLSVFMLLYIGAYNNGGAVAGFFNGSIQAIVFYNTALSAAQMAAVSTAMAALT